MRGQWRMTACKCVYMRTINYEVRSASTFHLVASFSGLRTEVCERIEKFCGLKTRGLKMLTFLPLGIIVLRSHKRRLNSRQPLLPCTLAKSSLHAQFSFALAVVLSPTFRE